MRAGVEERTDGADASSDHGTEGRRCSGRQQCSQSLASPDLIHSLHPVPSSPSSSSSCPTTSAANDERQYTLTLLLLPSGRLTATTDCATHKSRTSKVSPPLSLLSFPLLCNASTHSSQRHTAHRDKATTRVPLTECLRVIHPSLFSCRFEREST